jgi:hypothetical protein
MAIKKCIAARLGVIYDSQVTHRKQGGLSLRGPHPLLLVAWESYVTLSQLKIHKNTTANRWKLSLFD